MTLNTKKRLPRCKMLINNTSKNYKRRTECCNQTTTHCLRNTKSCQETRTKTSTILSEKSQSCNKVRKNCKKLSSSWNRKEIDEWMIIILSLKRNERFTSKSSLRLITRQERQIKNEILKCLSLKKRRQNSH